MIEHLLGAPSTGLYSHPLVEAILGPSWHPGGTELTLAMAKMAGLSPSDHLLDVGCGAGTSAAAIQSSIGCTVTGIDANPAAIAKASARHPDVSFAALPEGDLRNWSGEYTAILSECTMCLQGSPTETAQQYARLLAPGGRLLLSDVSVADEAADFSSAAAFIACLGGAVPQERLVDSLQAAGFRIDKVEARPELIGKLRDTIRGKIHVETALKAIGEPAKQWLELVEAAEAAYAAGHLSYSVVLATKVEEKP